MDGVAQIFDASSRLVLRRLKGHKQPVHVAQFAPDRVHVLSAGDDATVKPVLPSGSCCPFWDATVK